MSRRQQIMKLWAPHVEARALGPPHHRGQVMPRDTRQLSQTILCISRTVEGQAARAFPPTSFYARRRGTRVRVIQAQISQLDPPRVPQLFRAHHGLLHIQSIQQGEGDVQMWVCPRARDQGDSQGRPNLSHVRTGSFSLLRALSGVLREQSNPAQCSLTSAECALRGQGSRSKIEPLNIKALRLSFKYKSL